MVFTTPVFLFIFLPLTLCLYFLAKRKYQNALLLIASIICYSWGGGSYVLLLAMLIFINYVAGLALAKYENNKKSKKLIFILVLLIDIGVLVYYKYFNFILENLLNLLGFLNFNINIQVRAITLPIGISFFTFQILSYVIDVYKNKVEAQKNIIDLALYIMLFPQMIAGPIVRYTDINEQINNRSVTIEKFYAGIKRFIIGFSKKILLSNSAGYIADTIFENSEYYNNSIIAWVGIILYALQIYHDFSGYSDMAIGLGKMFGFDFLENFNYPYISKSIKEFWRRWHISLSTWFKDYIYIPLGGSREGKWKTYRNLLIVFIITGIWHGASWNFIVWGLWYGIFLILERGKFGEILEKMPTIIKRVYTLVIILIGWVFFRADNLTIAIDYIKCMFVFNINGLEAIYSILNVENITFCIAAIIFSTPIISFIKNKICEKVKDNNIWILEIIEFIILIIIFLLAILYMTGSSYSPFIYFRF